MHVEKSLRYFLTRLDPHNICAPCNPATGKYVKWSFYSFFIYEEQFWIKKHILYIFMLRKTDVVNPLLKVGTAILFDALPTYLGFPACYLVLTNAFRDAISLILHHKTFTYKSLRNHYVKCYIL